MQETYQWNTTCGLTKGSWGRQAEKVKSNLEQLFLILVGYDMGMIMVVWFCYNW